MSGQADGRASVMRCRTPVLVSTGDGSAQRFACGWCRVCMASHAREWSSRLQLEVLASGSPLVVRLSYADAFLPWDGLPSVVDVEVGWRRIRDALHAAYGVDPRFYLVAELGEQFGRPHYHVLVWGLPGRVFSESARLNKGFPVLLVQDVIERAWRFGQVRAEAPRDDGAACGYLTQYFEKGRALQRAEHRRALGLLRGEQLERALRSGRRRVPGERVVWFHRMTPGISSGSVDAVASVFGDEQGQLELARRGDVPASVRVGGKLLSLPRYVRRKLRARLGVDGIEAPAARAEAVEMAARVRDVGSVSALRKSRGHVDEDVADAAVRRLESKRSRRR